MKVSHIKHVVLYAKNFYRHTGDVVKDLQRFAELDGHPFWTVKTPEKLLNVIRKDYLEWCNSIEDEHDRKHCIESADNSVRWEEGVPGRLWCMLNTYKIFVPLTKDLAGLKYDKYHMPQFNIREGLFKKDDTFENWMKIADDFLSKTQEERFDEYMNNLMDKYPFEKLAEVFVKMGCPVTAKELEDEMWETYTQYMDEFVQPDGSLKSAYTHRYSEHFHLEFSSRNYNVGIDAHAKLSEVTYGIEGECNMENMKKLTDMAIADDQFINDRLMISNMSNEVFSDYWDKHFDSYELEFEWVKNCLISVCEGDILKEEFINDVIKRKIWGLATGSFDFHVEYKDNKLTLQIMFESIFECSPMDNQLFSSNGVIDGPHY